MRNRPAAAPMIVFRLIQREAAGDGLVCDAGSELGVERVEVDVEVDVAYAACETVEGGDDVAALGGRRTIRPREWRSARGAPARTAAKGRGRRTWRRLRRSSDEPDPHRAPGR